MLKNLLHQDELKLSDMDSEIHISDADFLRMNA